MPSHLGGGAAVQTTLEMISVPDTGRLSMHRMRSQTRWSVIGLCVWLHMPCVSTDLLTCICMHSPCVFVHACVSVIEKKIGYGHAYGGLAVIHGCGWMAEGSVFQLLITELYPATTFSLFALVLVSVFLCLALFMSFPHRIVSSVASSMHFLCLPVV